MNLPHEFLQKMKKYLGDEFPAFLQSYDNPRAVGIRSNRLKIGPEILKEKLSYLNETVPWCSDGFYYNEQEVRPSKHPYYYAGLYYIQEPSAMLPAELLNVKDGDCVLDLCAAPGGKSVQLAGKLGCAGILVANDINPQRARVLLKNIERYGVVNAIVLNDTPERIASVFKGFFDKILVDAPCSGEGMFHKEPEMAKAWSEHEVLKYMGWQSEILKFIPEMLKSSGELVYSTCTFSRQENEEQVEQFLTEHPEFKLLEIKRLWPHQVKGEGHFAAKLKYNANGQEKVNKTIKDAAASLAAQQAIGEFSSQFWGDADSWRNWLPPGGVVVERSGHLIWEKNGLPSLKGLKVLRSGWLLGIIDKKRFRPSQAFAMGLCKKGVQAAIQRLDLSGHDEHDRYTAIRYLRGETIQQENRSWSKGWHLITIDGYPIGWGKGAGFSLKNEYPPGWRWQDKDEG